MVTRDRECDALKKYKYDNLNIYRSSHTKSALIEYNESKIHFSNLCKTRKMEFENDLRKKLLATRNNPN